MPAVIVTKHITVNPLPPFITTLVEIETVDHRDIGVDAVAEFIGCHVTDPLAVIQFESEPLAALIHRRGERSATLVYVIDLDPAGV